MGESEQLIIFQCVNELKGSRESRRSSSLAVTRDKICPKGSMGPGSLEG